MTELGEADAMAAEFNIDPHLRTWRGFCQLMFWTVISIAIVLILMAFFIV